MLVFKLVMTMLCVLMGVAYVTLLERKMLSYMQIRKGPNKVGLMGLLQPFSDALKLFLKEMLIPYSSNKIMFVVFPILGLGLGLVIWGVVPSFNSLNMLKLSGMLFLAISALNVYVVLGAGWASNSMYAFLGGLRASAQTISYEISLVFILLLPLFCVGTLNLQSFISSFPVGLLFVGSLLLWFMTSLAETNRAPFDFAEGESELVSGFNVEYGGGAFALLFLGEYAVILFMSVITGVLFFGPPNLLALLSASMGVVVGFLVARGVYPRYRYDMLMSLCWKATLPMALGSLGLFFVMLPL